MDMFFAIFCRKPFSDHFYQIILNSGQWFEIFKIVIIAIRVFITATSHVISGGHAFLPIKLNLGTFVEGDLVLISAKLFLNLTIGFRGEDA